MEQQPDAHETRPGTAMTALKGAAAGTIAVWAMDRADWFMWNRVDREARDQTISVRPGGEPPAHVVASKIEEFANLEPSASQHQIAGKAIHYSIGIGPAAGYALLRDKLPGEGPMRGLLYGLSMFLVQDEVLNAISGLSAKPQDYPWQAHARGLVAHLVYGLTTELALSAMERRPAQAASQSMAS